MAFVEDSSSFFLRVNDAFKSFDSDSDGILLFYLYFLILLFIILILIPLQGFLNVKEMKAVVFAVCGERLSKVINAFNQ